MPAEYNNIKLLYNLFKAALCRPRQTLRLLNFGRLWNLYITLFRQPEIARRNVFDHYLHLFHEDSSENIEIYPFKMQEIRPEDLSFQYTPAPEVSIVIPVHNQFDTTLRCLWSIKENTGNIEYEIIIADDASTDQTKYIENLIKNVKITRNHSNLGFLNNCNKAVEEVNAPYIVFLNNDTFVTDGWLEPLLNTIKNDCNNGIVGAKLLFPDGKLQEAGGVVFSDGSGWNYGRGDDPGKPEYNYLKEVDYVSGACLLIGKELWDLIGGFDVRFSPAYYEDTDLAFTARQIGYKVIYQPQAVVIHYEGMSCGIDETSGVKKYQIINKEKFYKKWKETLEKTHFNNSLQLFRARERNRDKKTVLVIDHQVPLYDEDAGSMSTFQYLKWFVAKGFVVKFIGDDFCRHEKYTNSLQQLGVEVLYGQWFANHWKKWLKENGKNIDYVYMHRPQIAAKYIRAAKKYTKAKIIFFGHDLHYLRTQRQYDVENDSKLIQIAKDWQKKELSVFNKVDVIYYPSEVEVTEVRKCVPQAVVRAIPLYIYNTIEPVTYDLGNRKDLFFVGGFRHEPNVDGILWLVNEVFPLLLKKLPKIKLFIAGSKMPAIITDLNSKHVETLGAISREELEKYYFQSKVFVAPLRYGAGIKGKILESLYYQLPVVTTTCGAEGLAGAENFMMISDGCQQFADNIYEIYEDDMLWKELSGRGREFLLDQYSLSRVDAVLGEDFIGNNNSLPYI